MKKLMLVISMIFVSVFLVSCKNFLSFDPEEMEVTKTQFKIINKTNRDINITSGFNVFYWDQMYYDKSVLLKKVEQTCSANSSIIVSYDLSDFLKITKDRDRVDGRIFINRNENEVDEQLFIQASNYLGKYFTVSYMKNPDFNVYTVYEDKVVITYEYYF